ncbi:alkaline-phosphatase-like protein [Xylariales sp. PMI_506]|nr:alkaline-phosphatase-like protein [Xylariales sp. PMI_506]
MHLKHPATALIWLLSLLRLGYAASSRPNIVFILTDDQDTHMNSLDYMPRTQKYIIEQGTLFEKHYCTVAICCPSRVNLWTGRMPHNTNVTDVEPPYGGYPKFVSQGFNEDHLAYWMQSAGYNTYYSGKLFNAHTLDNYNSPPVQGYTGSEFLLDPTTYQYFNASTTRNGQPPVSYAGLYSPDVTAEKAYGFLEEAIADKETPFFLTVAPVAPHGDVTLHPQLIFAPPGVADRHRDLFKDYKIPRTPNFNPEDPSGVSWVAKLPRLNDTVIEYNDEYQRCRLRALQAVDEMVEKIVLRLESAGILDNTYIFYSTDNGYHISQHRMHPGKECGFDTDINIPLLVRGPGVAAGRRQLAVSSHTDLAPTILKLAGVPLKDSLDGTPIALGATDETRHEHLGIEFWGDAIPEGLYGYKGTLGRTGENIHHNNTYKGLRLESDKVSLYYSVWCSGEHELYNMKDDPWQLHNLLSGSSTDAVILGRSLQTVIGRLDALMMVIKSCKGDTCRYPWRSLHPVGSVTSLAEALDPKFDAFYESQPKVSFSRCEFGYIKEAEGPQNVFAYSEGGVEGSRYIGGVGEQKPMVIDPNWGWWT